MTLKHTNNAKGTLAAGISDSDTAISLTAGHGARFPVTSAEDFFYATLIDTSNNLEIIKVTARATDALTVERGQDGTTARAYLTGDRIELRWCNAMIESVQDEAVRAVATSGADTYTATLRQKPKAYNTDQVYAIRFAAANTVAAPTLNLNALGAKTIKDKDGAALLVGQLRAGEVVLLWYDGTDFRLLSRTAHGGTVQVFESSDTWNKPAGLRHVDVEVVGAGGPGGNSAAFSTAGSRGGAGGGGGYAKKRILAADLGSSETVTVGTSGSGTSSFGAHCSASPGVAGSNAADGVNSPGNGDGGVGTGGDVDLSGSKGHDNGSSSDRGGQSRMGYGALPAGSDSVGTAATEYGGGGSGGTTSTFGGPRAGGAGGAGVVIVWEYYE